jgi:hypothetical protein
MASFPCQKATPDILTFLPFFHGDGKIRTDIFALFASDTVILSCRDAFSSYFVQLEDFFGANVNTQGTAFTPRIVHYNIVFLWQKSHLLRVFATGAKAIKIAKAPMKKNSLNSPRVQP